LIKKSLLFSAVLVLLFIGIIKILRPLNPITQHQWQGNLIKAEEYIYYKGARNEQVILGSSLSNRLVMDSLSGFDNLSFPGEGIFDGLDIIDHQKKPPKYVFIEMNIVMRSEDKIFLSSLFNPLFFEERKWIPALRDGRQPLAIGGMGVIYIVHGLINRLKPHRPSEESANALDANKSDLLEELVQREVINYSQAPNQKILKQSLDHLDDYVHAIEKKGARVIFFEMPINPRLCDLLLPRTIREGFHQKFPKDRYAYIDQPSCALFKTTDGVHLNDEEAARYSSYFKEMAQERIFEKSP
jgi:hypothetical protein